jgi:hypothetical protein
MILYFAAVQLVFAVLVAIECGLVLLLAGIFVEQYQPPRPENCEIDVVYDI